MSQIQPCRWLFSMLALVILKLWLVCFKSCVWPWFPFVPRSLQHGYASLRASDARTRNDTTCTIFHHDDWHILILFKDVWGCKIPVTFQKSQLEDSSNQDFWEFGEVTHALHPICSMWFHPCGKHCRNVQKIMKTKKMYLGVVFVNALHAYHNGMDSFKFMMYRSSYWQVFLTVKW